VIFFIAIVINKVYLRLLSPFQLGTLHGVEKQYHPEVSFITLACRSIADTE